MEVLIRHGADVNNTDVDDHTALYRVTKVNSVKAVRELLESGGDVSGFSKD